MKIIFRILFWYGLLCWSFGLIAGLFERDVDLIIGLLILGGIFALIYCCVKFLVAFQQRREEDAIERKSPAVAQDIKAAIFAESILIATLLERHGSEQFLHEKDLPPNIEITTRRVHLDWLSRIGIREALDPWLNDLLFAPDGHWTPEQMDRVALIWEYFEVLRWVMGLAQLRHPAERPKFGGNYAIQLVDIKKPLRLRYLPPWEARAARDEASEFYTRCWYELAARGEIEGATEEEVRTGLEMRAAAEENCFEGDSRIAGYYMPAVASPTIKLHMESAGRRWQVLGLLVEVLGGDQPPSSLRHLLRDYLAPELKTKPELSSSSV